MRIALKFLLAKLKKQSGTLAASSGEVDDLEQRGALSVKLNGVPSRLQPKSAYLFAQTVIRHVDILEAV
jgi:hypothetical protein